MREDEGAPRDAKPALDRPTRPDADRAASPVAIQSFLIADIRGYTSFTASRGDEAAAALAARFAAIVGEQIGASGGSLIELRGDEVLVAFDSPRQAIRAAVDLQARLLEETRSTPELPLPVGIGLDAGEAVPVDDGYRGGAINLASRLCGEAAAGEILASQEIVHLAGPVQGIRYVDRGVIDVKGLAEPVHVVAVASEQADVAAAMTTLVPVAPTSHPPRGRLQFRILGPLEVVAGRSAVSLGGPKQRAVLAHLIVRANELVTGDTLIDLVWDDEPPETARSIIQTYVSLLRKAIGQDRIVGQAPGYRLRLEPTELDASRFDALVRDGKKAMPVDPNLAVRSFEQALALWRGPALADLADQRSIFAEAARLDELRLEAQSARLESLLAAGHAARAIGDLEALLTTHSLSENLWALLMLAYYREGRQGDALGAFHRARRVLADELGIDPSPDLVRLHERILQQDPSLELRGEPLRGYRLLEKIDDGSIGVVYRAIQPKVGRDVAVRIFHEQVAGDADFARRFEQQAQAVAGLEHPYIAPVYDYWREPSRAYIVSRYLKGGSLQALHDRGATLDHQAAARIVDHVASALGFAHRQGIAHGDVSPANVRFDGEGNAYLADFVVGLVESGDQRADLRRLATLATGLLPGNDRVVDLAGRVDSVDDVDADAFSAAVSGQVVGPGSAPTTRADARNPYKGLRAFLEADARDFFGRGELTRRLLRRLAVDGPEARFLAVVGPSGAGKSSVVRAALVPEIRHGALEPSELSFVAEMLPGNHPLDELEAALQRVAVRPFSRLRDVLDGSSRGFLEAVHAVLPQQARLTLIVDQFEETFTLTNDESEREAFLESLRVAAADPDSRVRIVVTMRADFYDRPLIYPRFGELFAARTEAVAPLTPDELEEAIRRPAEAVGVSVEPGLVAEMIADVAHQPGALPLVQYALTETFERRDDIRLTLATYRRIGGIAGALSARADRIFDASDSNGQHTTKQVFLRLVTLGEGQGDTRRRVVRSELDALEVGGAGIDAVLDAFGRHRLLTFDREPATREPTVEIAHEALLTAWRRLAGWIDGAREDLRQERRVARAAAEWRASERDPSFLMRGVRLEQVEAWARTTDLALATPERAYLKASLDERDLERRQQEEQTQREARLEARSRFRLRVLVAVLAVATLVATSLTLVAVSQEQKAIREGGIARVRELSAAALAEREVDPERAILLGIKAVDMARDLKNPGAALNGAEDALHRAIAASRVDLTVPGTGGKVAWGPNGIIATLAVEASGSVDLRDAATGAVMRTIDAHDGEISDLAWSPDGRWLATAGEDGWLRLWDRTTAQPGVVVEGIGPVSDLAFSGDGRRIAAAWPDESAVRVIATSSGQEVWHHLGPIGDGLAGEDPPLPGIVGLSADGRQVAVGPGDAGRLRVFNTESGQEAYRPLDVPFGASAVAWSPNGRVIATVGLGGADLWEATTGEHLDDVFGHASGLNVVAWSADSTLLATGVDDAGDVIVWDYAEGRLDEWLTLVSDPTGRGVAGLAFSADGTRLMAGALDNSAIKVWDLTPQGAAEWAVLESTGSFGDVAFMPDSRRLVSVDTDGFARIHDLGSGARSEAIGPRVAEHAFDVSPDGRWLVFGSAIWDLATGARHFTFTDAPYWDGASWSDDSRLIAVANGTEGHGIEVLDSDGHPLVVLPEREGYETAAARFSPDGQRLVTMESLTPDVGLASGRITVWDWRQQAVLETIETPLNEDLDLDPTGHVAATGFGPPAIWDLEVGTRLGIDGVDGTKEVAFSPNGSLLGVPFQTTVRLIDTTTGEVVQVLHAGDGALARLDFSPDGTKLAAHGLDGVYVWALDLDELIAIGRRELTRTWTDEECQRFLHLERCAP